MLYNRFKMLIEFEGSYNHELSPGLILETGIPLRLNIIYDDNETNHHLLEFNNNFRPSYMRIMEDILKIYGNDKVKILLLDLDKEQQYTYGNLESQFGLDFTTKVIYEYDITYKLPKTSENTSQTV